MRQNSSLDHHPHGQTQVEMPPEFSIGAVAAWLDQLPLVNSDYSADALLAALRALNGVEGLSSAERFDMLEQLRPTAYLLSQQGAERHLHDPAFPLSAALNRHADRGSGLPSELGKGYRQVVMGADFLSNLTLGEDSRALVIYRALEAYGTTLLRLSEGYGAAHPGFWHDVYGLYHTAETLGLHQLAIADDGPGPSGPARATIFDRFTHIVLFELSGSHRHRPGKIRQIDELLGIFASKAQIDAAPAVNGENALFCFDLGTDVPPRHIDAFRRRKGGNQRFVFTHVLIQFLLKHFEDPANRRLNGRVLDKPSIKRLLRALGALERRKSSRISEHGQCSLLVGLDRLIGALSGTTKQQLVAGDSIVQYKGINWLKVPNYALDGLESQESTGGMTVERVRSERSIGKTLYESRVVVSRAEIWDEQGTGVPLASPEAVRLSGQLINSSARGYCLLWTKRVVASAKVGELVGLAVNEDSLHIGVIRWLHQDANADLTLGVELLSPTADVVEVNFTGARESSRKALFLPSNAGLQQPAGLLISPSCYESGHVTVAAGTGTTKTYRLEKLLESTPSFQYFSLL